MTHPALLLAPILFPIIFGALIPFLRLKEERRDIYIVLTALINACITGYLIFNPPQGVFTLVSISDALNLAFRLDGLSVVFGGLVAGLWPFATLYAVSYMKHGQNTSRFFAFYIIAFGFTIGVAFSANFFTLYLFYEFLSFSTLPLVTHYMDAKSAKAGKYYLFYSISGASAIFIGLVYILNYAGGMPFQLGGFIGGEQLDKNLLLGVYFLAFLGFGVKSAIVPLHGWLPMASVAPTPATALLHAVAVVKAGVFAMARLTYYTFNYVELSDTWVQAAMKGLAALTIIYASYKMYKEAHVKRALVYSTISNLSYIVLAISIMSPAGLAAGLAHMIFHGITKVVLFFCIGIMFAKWGLEYKNQLYGTGKRAPLMYTAFIIASLSMIGFPLMPGFLGKWHVVRAGMELFSSFGYVGVAAIAYSTVVTALYLIPIAMHAFLAGGGHEEAHAELKHSGLEKERFDMLLFPTVVIVLAIIYFGLFSLPLFYMLGSITGGLN